MNKTATQIPIFFALAMIGGILSGCTGQSQPITQSQTSDTGPQSIDNQHPLAWVQRADPLLDAQQAIKNRDPRLLAFAGRAISMPGIDLAVYPLAELQQRCGYRVIKGTGDVVKNQNELPLRSKMHDYALIYNQHMLSRCFTK
ncbi:MAG: hypothetical protein ACI9C4_000856 [Paraglaciecola sp.]|jgi:hypothetical protein